MLESFCTVSLVGVVWLVQLAVYPGFRRIEPERFKSYHAWYNRRISLLVVPLMLTEATLSTYRLISAGDLAAQLGFVLLLGVWLLTFGWIVPIHRKLARGYDAARIDRLVALNALRTLLWSGRGLLLTAGPYYLQS